MMLSTLSVLLPGEVTCARPGCGKGYRAHVDPEGGYIIWPCEGFCWVEPPPRPPLPPAPPEAPYCRCGHPLGAHEPEDDDEDGPRGWCQGGEGPGCGCTYYRPKGNPEP